MTAPTEGGTLRGPDGAGDDDLDHETQSDRRDATTQWRIFVAVGAFIALIDVVYWFVSYEEAGTTMLALASALALYVGVFLWTRERRVDAGLAAPTEAGAARDIHEGPYLPSASVWPLAVGISTALALNGLILGWPFAVPGAVALGLSVVGFVAQSRGRS